MSTEPLPNGTLTFLFTDIEGSTALWERHGEAMRPALAAHDALLRAAVLDHNGRIVKTTGDGIHAAFSSGADALAAAQQAQTDLCGNDWGGIAPDRICVRMGLHTGEAELRDGDYYGSAVNRAARLMSIGHGGQILVSGITAGLIQEGLRAGTTLRDLGDHTLRGLARSERVYQVVTPGLPDDFAALRTTAVFIGNLPARVTSFVGRSREMAQVREALRTTRLLTLTGPGGTGKTTLSLQVAADVQPNFEHGAWWVELAPISDPALVPTAVFSALGLAAAPGGQMEPMLFDYLREKQLLLVLDNCEHLIEPSARLAAQLIESCPRLTILASSREGLGVYGETTFHLPTLTLPDPATATAQSARLSEAVQLFVERAAAARSGFELDDSNVEAVVKVVRRLDGIPLAIELAAARITVFGVEQIASRLDDRFRLLTGGSRTALPRQQTLRALIDWSYDLLDEDERALFRRLSVFNGGWTFDAAEYMAGDLDAYTLFPQLINKSLVVVAEAPADIWGEVEARPEPRYMFLETIRQYARDRLDETDEAEAVRDRHFQYYSELAGKLDFGAGRGAELLTSGRLLQERDNLQAAAERGLERYPTRVIDMCWELAIFLADQNPGGDGIRWVNTALAKVATVTPTDEVMAVHLRRARFKGLVTVALLSLWLGNVQEAHQIAGSVLEPLRAGDGDPMWLAIALFVTAQSGYFLESPDTGAIIDEALVTLRSLPDHPIRHSLLALAMLASALIEADKGHDVAQSLIDEASALIDQAGGYYLPWVEYLRMGLLWAVHEDPVVIGQKLQLSLERLRAGRSYRVMGMLESDYAHALREIGMIDEAAEIYRRTIVLWQDLGHRSAVANQLECLAYIYRVWSEPRRAVRLLGAAERLREEAGQAMLGPEQIVYDRELKLLRSELPQDELDRLWLEGRALSTNAAVKLAINDTGD